MAKTVNKMPIIMRGEERERERDRGSERKGRKRERGERQTHDSRNNTLVLTVCITLGTVSLGSPAPSSPY